MLDYMELWKGKLSEEEVYKYVSTHNIYEGLDGGNMLHTLCRSVLCYEKSILYLLEKGLYINSENYMGETPLHLFCRHTYYPMQNPTYKEYEIDCWCQYTEDYIYQDVITYVYNKNNPLMKKTPEILLNNGANMYAMDIHGRNSLFGCYDKTIILYLIKHGLHIDSRDNYGCTPLFFCTDEAIIKYMVELGADFTIKDEYGRYAVEYNKSKYLQELCVMNGIEIEESNKGYAKGSIMAIRQTYNRNQTEDYIQSVKSTNSLYAYEECNCLFGHNTPCVATLDALKILYEDGFDLTEIYDSGDNLLEMYCSSYYQTTRFREEKELVIQWLYSIGLRFSEKFNIPERADLDLETIKLFVSVGYDINKKNREFKTLFDEILAQDDKKELVEFLAQNHAACDITDIYDSIGARWIDLDYLPILAKYHYLSEEDIKPNNIDRLVKNRKKRFSYDFDNYFEDESGRTCWRDEDGRTHKNYIDEDDQFNDPDNW